jgi:hypothetical protein
MIIAEMLSMEGPGQCEEFIDRAGDAEEGHVVHPDEDGGEDQPILTVELGTHGPALSSFKVLVDRTSGSVA